MSYGQHDPCDLRAMESRRAHQELERVISDVGGEGPFFNPDKQRFEFWIQRGNVKALCSWIGADALERKQQYAFWLARWRGARSLYLNHLSYFLHEVPGVDDYGVLHTHPPLGAPGKGTPGVFPTRSLGDPRCVR